MTLSHLDKLGIFVHPQILNVITIVNSLSHYVTGRAHEFQGSGHRFEETIILPTTRPKSHNLRTKRPEQQWPKFIMLERVLHRGRLFQCLHRGGLLECRHRGGLLECLHREGLLECLHRGELLESLGSSNTISPPTYPLHLPSHIHSQPTHTP